MWKEFRTVFICTLLCLAMFHVLDISFDMIENASGDTIYVNTTGSGGAFTSIQDAINAADHGDTVYVYRGIYNGCVTVNKRITLIGEDRENTIINGSGSGDVVIVTDGRVSISGFMIIGSGTNYGDAGIQFSKYAQNCRIFNNKVSDNYFGINVYYSGWNDITGNNVSNNNDGIYLKYSSGNNIIGNNVSNNDYGIWLYDSNWNNITNNNATSNNWNSIYLGFSRCNNLTGNTMIGSGILIVGNSLEYWDTHNIDVSNSVNGKPVYYWKNSMDDTVPQGAGQVILVNCTNVTIECQELTYGSVGIELGFSSNNNIIGNNVSNNWDGIYLYLSNNNNIASNTAFTNNWDGIYIESSSENNIIGNTASNNWYGICILGHGRNNIISNVVSSNNEYGIFLWSSNGNNLTCNKILGNTRSIRLLSSSGNMIYHNNFISNTNQALDNTNNGNRWDNGYPLGGNYWSDYGGVDSFKGPSQEIPGKDGIGDIPYTKIRGDAGAQDNYPFMAPYKPLENYTILKQGWNLISIPLTQEEENLTRVLGSIDGWYDATQWYDVTDKNDPWKHKKVGKPFGNDLSEINETMGFWIHITRPGDTIFLYDGIQPTKSQRIPLHPGWNLVGYPSSSNKNRTAALNNITFGTDVDSIWTFNAAEQKWEEVGESDYFEIGKGYWIHSITTCVWKVPL